MKVIKRNNLPKKLPVIGTLVMFLALDYWNAPQWLLGAMGILYLLIWCVIIISIIKEEEVDLFDATPIKNELANVFVQVIKDFKPETSFIQRIKDEKELLDEKVDKLSKFIISEKFDSLDDDMKSLLSKQFETMKKYSEILQRRLELLEKSENNK